MLDGKRVRERGDTPADCLERRDERRGAQVAQHERRAVLDSDVTVGELVRRWVEFVSTGKAPQTVSGYHWSQRHVVARIGDRAAADVRVDDIEAMFIALIGDGFSKASLAKMRSHLAKAFRWGVRRRLVISNPVADIEMPGGAVEPVAAVWLDVDEFAAMRACLQRNVTTHKLVLLTSLLTGMRPGEAEGLCWENLDLDAGLVHVRTAIQDSQDGRVRKLVPKLKTHSSRRTLQLPADLVVALRSHRKTQAEQRLAARAWAEPRLVFTTETGEIIDSSNLARACRGACKGAGTKAISPNGMRHSHASMLLHRGVSVAEVARQLGHDDLRMVTQTYGHAMVDIVAAAAVLDSVG
jgi:integrase